MARSFFTFAAVAAGLLALTAPSVASACGKDEDCGCPHAEKKRAKKSAAEAEKAAKEKGAAPAVPADGEKKAPEAGKAAPEAQLLRLPTDATLAAKCDCAGPADCTCKKGECKCSKCSKSHRGQAALMDTLSGQRDVLRLPEHAHNNARSGAFI